MQTSPPCFPCFLRQARDAARGAGVDAATTDAILARVREALEGFDVRESPPVMAQQIHRLVREFTGQADPYADVKRRFNEHALMLLPHLREAVMHAADPFEAAAKLAIAGNQIDFGAHSGLTEADATDILSHAVEQTILGDAAALREAAQRARRIVYLLDNAGEIVLDRMLLEQLPVERVTAVVRGRPVLNDATLADAREVGLTDLVRVIDNGSDAPATLVEDCSPAFRGAFDAADLIIAKGQGNYESLAHRADRPISFLLIPKCPLVADQIGCPVGRFVLRPAAKETFV
ncbi:MAG: damage-control phosphatase ARMT1 family protein [Phycisphaeraceae bacterium]